MFAVVDNLVVAAAAHLFLRHLAAHPFCGPLAGNVVAVHNAFHTQGFGGGDEFQIFCSMATIFSLGPEGADKLCPVRIRVQARNPKVDVKQVTPLRIAAKVWNSAPGSKERQKFCLDEKTKKIFDDVEAIRHDIYKRLDEGQALTAAQVKDIVNFHVFSEVRKQEEEEAAFVKAEEAERNRVTLRKFIDQFLLDIKSGKR